MLGFTNMLSRSDVQPFFLDQELGETSSFPKDVTDRKSEKSMSMTAHSRSSHLGSGSGASTVPVGDFDHVMGWNKRTITDEVGVDSDSLGSNIEGKTVSSVHVTYLDDEDYSGESNSLEHLARVDIQSNGKGITEHIQKVTSRRPQRAHVSDHQGSSQEKKTYIHEPASLGLNREKIAPWIEDLGTKDILAEATQRSEVTFQSQLNQQRYTPDHEINLPDAFASNFYLRRRSLSPNVNSSNVPASQHKEDTQIAQIIQRHHPSHMSQRLEGYQQKKENVVASNWVPASQAAARALQVRHKPAMPLRLIPQELPLLTLENTESAAAAVSNFSISLTEGQDHYHPEDEITGTISFNVWSRTLIRYVEFILQGRGTIRFFKDSTTLLDKPRHEVYLDKRILLISPPEGSKRMILNPGHYVSNFTYKLPAELPPSIHQYDMGKGYMFDISYIAQANICDDLPPTMKKVRHNARKGLPLYVLQEYAKIAKSTRCKFYLELQDIWDDALTTKEPVLYREQVLLFCSCRSDPTVVKIHLDQGVYSIGGTIRVDTEISMPAPKQVKHIRVQFEQHMTVGKDGRLNHILIQSQDEAVKYSPDRVLSSQFVIPIPPNLIPSNLPRCRILVLSYDVKVTVQFRGLGGKLTVRLPVTITPARTFEKFDEPPINSATRPALHFPHFSSKSFGNARLGGTVAGTSLGPTESRIQRSISHSKNISPGTLKSSKKFPKKADTNITTKYRTGIRCCACCLLCCGFGIYNIND